MSYKDNALFAQLKKEHEEVKSLFKKAEKAEGRERASILSRIEEALVPHARAEEKTLYAVLLAEAKSENHEDATFTSHEAYEEHRVADNLLSELKKLPVTDETWAAHLAVLKENIEHHIKEEENELFENATKMLSTETLDALADAYNVAKEGFADSLPTQGQISEREPSPLAKRA